MPIDRFISSALQRMQYSFELEWIDGGSGSHIQALCRGSAFIERRPGIFGFIYSPLYHYVAALPSWLFGLGLFAPWLLSFVSMLGSFAMLARWVRDETGDAVAGIAAAGLLSSVYQITGMWMDLARVDSFFLLITFAANVFERSTHTRRCAALVGLLLAAACFTKQLGIPSGAAGAVVLDASLAAAGPDGSAGGGRSCSRRGAGLRRQLVGLVSLLPAPAARTSRAHEVQWQRLWPETRTYFLGNTLPMTLAGVASLCGAGFARNGRIWLYSWRSG